MRTSALLLVVVLAAGGCASVAPPAPSAPVTADQRAAVPAALAVERQWLLSWFRETPVAIGQARDGAVTIDVPREFCFDPGHSSVKPPLAAVLDKVAESLRRRPLHRLGLLAAPADAAGGGPLARQRAMQVQAYLRSRGVPATRLARPTVAVAAAVRLRIEAAPL